MPEKKGDRKFNAEEYMDVIMDGELFNRWKKGMEELGDLLIMEDGAGYLLSRHCEQKKRAISMARLGSRKLACKFSGLKSVRESLAFVEGYY